MVDPDFLIPLMDLIEQRLSSANTSYAGDYAAFRNSLRELEQELIVEAGARFGVSCGAHTMRLAGVTTTCTSGLPGLFRNWLHSARRQVENAGCPGHVASRINPKLCGRCGAYAGDERPEDDVFNPFGSGPLPVEAREPGNDG